MSVSCIGAVIAAVLLTSNVRECYCLCLTPGPSNQITSVNESSDDSDDDSNGSTMPGGFSDAVRKSWPNLAHAGSRYSPRELESFLQQPGGSVLRKD